MAAIQAMIAEVEASMSPSPARRALLAEAEQLAAAIAARFGDIDGADDVAAALRDVRCPPGEWDDLNEALAAAGAEPTDDPLAVAYAVLQAAREHNAPADRLDAELVDLRGRLAAFDPEAVARHGSLGVVAGELIRIDRMYERIVAQVTGLRSRLTEELGRDPAGADRPRPDPDAGPGADRADRPQPLERDRAGGAGTPARMLEAAVTGADGNPWDADRGPVRRGARPGRTRSRAAVVECVDQLVALADERQIVVLTPIEGLVHAAHIRGDVQLSGFN